MPLSIHMPLFQSPQRPCPPLDLIYNTLESCSLLSSSISMSRASLTSLPNEIHLEIISYFQDDIHTLKAIHNVNRHFFSLMPRGVVKAALLYYENSRKHFLANCSYFPCYGCFQVLTASKYWDEMLNSKKNSFDLGGTQAHRRRCRICDAKQRKKFLKSLSVIVASSFMSFCAE
jgi:hypothetical protein